MIRSVVTLSKGLFPMLTLVHSRTGVDPNLALVELNHSIDLRIAQSFLISEMDRLGGTPEVLKGLYRTIEELYVSRPPPTSLTTEVVETWRPELAEFEAAQVRRLLTLRLPSLLQLSAVFAVRLQVHFNEDGDLVRLPTGNIKKSVSFIRLLFCVLAMLEGLERDPVR